MPSPLLTFISKDQIDNNLLFKFRYEIDFWRKPHLFSFEITASQNLLRHIYNCKCNFVIFVPQGDLNPTSLISKCHSYYIT